MKRVLTNLLEKENELIAQLDNGKIKTVLDAKNVLTDLLAKDHDFITQIDALNNDKVTTLSDAKDIHIKLFTHNQKTDFTKQIEAIKITDKIKNQPEVVKLLQGFETIDDYHKKMNASDFFKQLFPPKNQQ